MLALFALSLYFTAGDASCDIQASVATDLTSAITSAVAAGHVAWQIHVDVPSGTVGMGPVSSMNTTPASEWTSESMDCLEVFEGAEAGTILGVFHCGAGGEGGHNALWVAQASASAGSLPGSGAWAVVGKLSVSGSQGFVGLAQDGSAFLAYEVEAAEGNRVAVRRYPSLAGLASASSDWREVQLTRDVVGADGTLFTAGNVGTPSLPKIELNGDGTYNLQLYFHYYTTSDIPGSGNVTFPGSGEGVVSDNYGWYGAFAADQNNAMRMAQAVGKIGQRAELATSAGARLQLYEAQMASAGESYYGWLSWRLLVYEVGCEGQAAGRVNLTLASQLQTFANPHAKVVGDYLYVGAFVPGEPFDAEEAASYAGCDALGECECPSCASNPMAGAGTPAMPGSFLTSVPLSDVLGGWHPSKEGRT
jgi:hypothetical protein